VDEDCAPAAGASSAAAAITVKKQVAVIFRDHWPRVRGDKPWTGIID